ncbi:hypothetical protein CBL_06512 [Carabus blaptoides fortunei]
MSVNKANHAIVPKTKHRIQITTSTDGVCASALQTCHIACVHLYFRVTTLRQFRRVNVAPNAQKGDCSFTRRESSNQCTHRRYKKNSLSLVGANPGRAPQNPK